MLIRYSKIIWGVLAPLLILIACILSNASLPVVVMSLIGILFVIGVSYHIPETNLLGAILCLFYGYYSYEQGFISNTIVNIIILFPLQVVAYLVWSKKLKIKESLKLLFEKIKYIVPIFLAIIYSIIIFISDKSTATLVDVTSASLVVSATLLLLIESKNQWYFWIPYNALEVVLWLVAITLSTEMLSILIMRVIFLMNSFYGFILWRRK